MLVRRVGTLLLLRQNTETASEAEWAQLLELLIALHDDLPNLKIMVRTDGGGPSPQQRRSLQAALAGSPARVAVVSDHLKVRFVVSTLALFQKDLRSFLVKELPDAYAHLSMSESERRHAQKALTEMEASLAPRA